MAIGFTASPGCSAPGVPKDLWAGCPNPTCGPVDPLVRICRAPPVPHASSAAGVAAAHRQVLRSERRANALAGAGQFLRGPKRTALRNRTAQAELSIRSHNFDDTELNASKCAIGSRSIEGRRRNGVAGGTTCAAPATPPEVEGELPRVGPEPGSFRPRQGADPARLGAAYGTVMASGVRGKGPLRPHLHYLRQASVCLTALLTNNPCLFSDIMAGGGPGKPRTRSGRIDLRNFCGSDNCRSGSSPD